MKTKKILVLLTSALLVIGLVAGGATMAYLFDQSGQKQNQFTHGTPSVDIEENSSGTPESSNVVSHGGNTAVKEVKVTNTGDIPLYVRVMLIPGWKETDGQAPAGKLDFGAEPMWKDDRTLVMGDVELHLNAYWANYWLYDSESRYFYHKASVAPQGSTALLLEKVVLPEGTEEVWDALQVEVLTDSIQAEGNAVNDAWKGVKKDQDGLLILA